MNVERALLKPPGWTRKTADMAAYRREYEKKMRQESPEKVREKDREKYARKMQRLRGEEWRPRQRLDPEEAARRKRERDRPTDSPP
jgi:hypothetical protein